MLLVLPGLQELIEFPEHPVAFRAPSILRLRKAHKALRATISSKCPIVSRALGALSHPTNKSAPSAHRAIRTSMAPKASKVPRVSRAFRTPKAPGLKVIPGLPGN